MRSLFGNTEIPEQKIVTVDNEENESSPELIETKKQVRCAITRGVHFAKRIKSELALEECLPWHFEKNVTYHCFSWGDVDSLTYLRVIVKQQKLEYVAISTWCMALTDVKELEKWLERGDIGHLDIYVGEIFQGSYADIYLALIKMMERTADRVCIFRNHSKVMFGFGEIFDFVIESSANINTNPRSENTSITVDSSLAFFYKDIFDNIINFTKDFDGWIPYTLQRDRDD